MREAGTEGGREGEISRTKGLAERENDEEE
jgi:hypothetical protein